jgi:hypothetical protein
LHVAEDILPTEFLPDLNTLKSLLCLKDDETISSTDSQASLHLVMARGQDESYSGVFKVIMGVTHWSAVKQYISASIDERAKTETKTGVESRILTLLKKMTVGTGEISDSDFLKLAALFRDFAKAQCRVMSTASCASSCVSMDLFA